MRLLSPLPPLTLPAPPTTHPQLRLRPPGSGQGQRDREQVPRRGADPRPLGHAGSRRHPDPRGSAGRGCRSWWGLGGGGGGGAARARGRSAALPRLRTRPMGNLVHAEQHALVAERRTSGSSFPATLGMDLPTQSGPWICPRTHLQDAAGCAQQAQLGRCNNIWGWRQWSRCGDGPTHVLGGARLLPAGKRRRHQGRNLVRDRR